MCDVCSQTRVCTHIQAHSRTWLNGLIGFKPICIWMLFPKYSRNKRSLRTVLILCLKKPCADAGRGRRLSCTQAATAMWQAAILQVLFTYPHPKKGTLGGDRLPATLSFIPSAWYPSVCIEKGKGWFVWSQNKCFQSTVLPSMWLIG